MTTDNITATDKVEAAIKYNTMPEDSMSIHGSYHAVCISPDGFIKWEDNIDNLVTTVGKNFTLDTTLGNTAGGAVVMGLKGAGTAVVADTQASHASWLEVGLANAPTYSGNRPTPSFSAASAGSKATSSSVSFSITSTGTVAGCFINIGGSATKDNTTGTLFSAGDFSSSKAVVNGDTIAVSYSATLT
jgi:hypothetical protein